MLSGQLFGPGGKTTPEYWIDGQRMRALQKGAIAEGYAVEARTIGGVIMKSTVAKRSIVVAGHKTSLSLEDAFLERVEGDRARAAHDLVGIGRRNRCSAATRQSVIGSSAFRARLLSHPTFLPKGRARRKSRDDRLHCACFFLSLHGQPYQPSFIHNAAPDFHPAQMKANRTRESPHE